MCRYKRLVIGKIVRMGKSVGLGIGKGALSICFPLDCYNSIVKPHSSH